MSTNGKLLTPKHFHPEQKDAVKFILDNKVGCIAPSCGFGKCLNPSTEIIMFDGSVKQIKDINVGDIILGDDDTPRTVLSKHSGVSDMYRVIPVKNEPWECNINHTLCVKMCSNTSRYDAHQYVDIDVKDYLELPKSVKAAMKQYSRGFDGWNSSPFECDPYFIGLWLGDGTMRSPCITTPDEEIISYLYDFADRFGMRVRAENTINSEANVYFLVSKEPRKGELRVNSIRTYLRENFGLGVCKILPDKFITVNRKDRLQLLAGLLDSDGYYSKCGFEITQKNKDIHDSINKLTRSLGFRVTTSTKTVSNVCYYRSYITGDLDLIPTKVKRKQAEPRAINKDHLVEGFSIEPIGEGEYVGIEVDGNNKFLLSNFTVVHNSITGLTAFLLLKNNKQCKKMLVVCTPKGVKETWSQEHIKWSHTKDLKVVSLVGSPTMRARLLEQEADVFCISYHSLEWLLSQPHCPNFDFIFADEGSCLKGASSKWRDILLKLSIHARYRIISSATPAPHDAMDYWGLCKFLDDGECLDSPNISTFRSIYCQQLPVPGRSVWVLRNGMDAVIEEKVKHLFFSVETPEAADIPIDTRIVRVDLSPEAQQIYDTVQEDQCLNSIIYDELGRIDDQDSLDALALSNKLAQMSNGFVYIDENLRLSDEVLDSVVDPRELLNKGKKKIAVDLFPDRIENFKRLIAGIHKKHGKDQQIVITYLFKHDLELLQKAFPEGVSDTESNIVNRWNNGEIKYLFLQYSRSSMSLNLQGGGHIIAVYSRTFVFQDWYQIIRRVARQGQKAPMVYVYVLHLNNTVDEQKQRRSDQRTQSHRNFQKKIIAHRRKK